MRGSKELRAQVLNTLGCVGYGHVHLVLQLITVMLLAGILMAVLVQGFKLPQGEDLIRQEVAQMKDAVGRLCRLCPWDWTLFQGNCYFFSSTKRNWKDSVAACEDLEAQLVIIENDEEQRFLGNWTSRLAVFMWMGLSDQRCEGTWEWVDGSPLSDSFGNYWSTGEPNNYDNEDCVEFGETGWNDGRCKLEKSWICKKPAASCPGHRREDPSWLPLS